MTYERTKGMRRGILGSYGMGRGGYSRHHFYRRDREIRNIHDTYGIFKAVQRVAATYNLQLVQEEGCKQPRTDMRTGDVIVDALNPYWPQEKLTKWLGEVYHEVGHHAPKCQDLMPLMEERGIGFNSLFGKMLNLVEDYRNEKNDLGYYVGRDEALSWTQGYYAQQGATQLGHPDTVLSEDMQFFVDALGLFYRLRGEWQPDVALSSMEYDNHCEYDRWLHLADEINAMQTGEDVYNIVIKMLELDDKKDPEEELAKAKAAFESGEECNERGKPGAGGEEGEEEEEGSGAGGDGEGDGDNVECTISYEDLMGDVHGEKGEVSLKDSKMSIKYDHSPRDDYVPHSKMRVIKARELSNSGHPTVKENCRKAYESGRKLASAARRLFQSRAQMRVSHNHKVGRLDKRDLYRIPAGAVDVFRQKDSLISTEGTAIMLLTDASGSMSGNKFNLTAASAALMNEAISLFNIPLMIAAFTESDFDGCSHFIVKGFKEKRKTADILSDYAKIYPELYQNADGESIMWAYHQLLSRPEPRKILIVISDGEPASDNEGDCYSYTRDVVKKVETEVECYGIGVLDNAVKNIYTDHIVLDKADELEQCLLDVIKQKLFV